MKQPTVQNRIEKRQTQFRFVYQIDWDDNGRFEEIAVVKEDESDGTIYGIRINDLHPIDKARLKRIITNQHADKYPLWELMSQITLKNGYNALDFFHTNYVRVKRIKGAVVSGGLMDVRTDGEADKMFDMGGFEREETVAGGSRSTLEL